YHAPRERFPQVALIAAWTSEGDAGMTVLPLYGAATLPIKVDAAHAALRLLVGGATFRGTADGSGRARMEFVAPPGVAMGTVQATDRLGNVKTQKVPLGIPDAPRIVLSVRPDEVPADGRAGARVLAFAATPDGRPDAG